LAIDSLEGDFKEAVVGSSVDFKEAVVNRFVDLDVLLPVFGAFILKNS
jgi:hypothetical protein